MTLYSFFKKPEYGDVNIMTLYAYTTDKKIAIDFKDQRDMSKFIMRKVKIDDKKEYSSFCALNDKCHLDYRNIKTRSPFIYGKRIPVSILCTKNEEFDAVVLNEKVFEKFFSSLYDVSMFKSKYIKALEKLMYVVIYRLYNTNLNAYNNDFYDPYFSSYDNLEGLILEDLKSSFSYDELAMFSYRYKDTFKIERK